jgi:hypothetical protein
MQKYLPSAIKVNKTGDVCTTKHRGAFKQPLLQWKSSKYYTFQVSVCCLRYPACNAHVPYVYCLTLLCFSTLSHKQKKKVIEHNMCVFTLSAPLSKNFFCSKKNK